MRDEAEAIAAISGTWQGEFGYTEWKIGPLTLRADPRRIPPYSFTARILVLGSAKAGALRFILSGEIDDPYGRSVIEGFVSDEAIEFNKRYVDLRPEFRRSNFQPIAYRGKLSADGAEMSGEWTIASRLIGMIPCISIGRWKSARVPE